MFLITKIFKNQFYRTNADFSKFEKEFQMPDISEGFSEILKFHFEPSFKNDEEKAMFSQFLY